MRTPLREIHEDASDGECISELELLREENKRKDAMINLFNERLMTTPKPHSRLSAERMHSRLSKESERRKQVAERLEYLAREFENEIFRY